MGNVAGTVRCSTGRIVLAILCAVMCLTSWSVTNGSHNNLRYGTSGWAGYGWNANSYAQATFTAPHVSNSGGDSIAFWAGLGDANPGIQQVGFSTHSGGSYTAWWEAWPANPVGFGWKIYAGNVVRVTVQRWGCSYRFEFQNLSRGWRSYAWTHTCDVEGQAEAVAEAYGPPVPWFSLVNVSASGGPSWAYDSIAGVHVQVAGVRSWRIFR